MTPEQIKASWIVEQAVYLKAHSSNSPWNLKQQVEMVVEALERATELVSELEASDGN